MKLYVWKRSNFYPVWVSPWETKEEVECTLHSGSQSLRHPEGRVVCEGSNCVSVGFYAVGFFLVMLLFLKHFLDGVKD